VSLLLQHGTTVADLARTLGESRQEGEQQGPPSSIIGAIVRRAIEVEKDAQQ